MDRLPCTLIIPAAGDSLRYKEAGFTDPKGLIEFQWRGVTQTMIQHCIPEGWPTIPRVVCKDRDLKLFQEKLSHVCSIRMVTDTDGQADTVIQAVDDIPGDILVVNCDNAFFLPPTRNLISMVELARLRHLNAAALVFKEHKRSTAYGYVNSFPNMDFGIEKLPISKYALAGAFYFSSKHVLTTAAHFMVDERNGYSLQGPNAQRLDFYLSELLAYIHKPKAAFLIDKDALHEWGTFEDLVKDETVTRINKHGEILK